MFGIAGVPAARAQLSFTISPVAGHVDQYTVTANCSFATPASSTDPISGSVTTDSPFFSQTGGYQPVVSGSIFVSYGDTPTPSTYLFVSGATLGVQFGDTGLMSNTSYDMVGSATSTFTSGTYADLIPGIYTITGGSDAFGPSQNYGTLTIEAAAIPEPATYAGVMAVVALGFVVWRRRRNGSEAQS